MKLLHYTATLYKSASFSLYRATAFAGSVSGLFDVASSCSFVEKERFSSGRMASGDLPDRQTCRQTNNDEIIAIYYVL